MPSEFPVVQWDEFLQADANRLIDFARDEDLSTGMDVTTAAIVDATRDGMAEVASREAGVLAGIDIGRLVLERFGAVAKWEAIASDGDRIAPGQVVARMQGRASDLLTCERTILNFLTRLCGIATLTSRFVAAAAGGATLYDTRKTTPGWRRLEKYAVACGGGANHRLGLSEAVLIKDNHLAQSSQAGLTPADAVRMARDRVGDDVVVEIEVDTLDQLKGVLPTKPDIVLLDNMSLDELREAASIRDAHGRDIVLEASGGVRLDTIGAIATTGVDRISVGALTHSAVGLDLGLDWQA